jgi:hypothetical protein
MIALAIVAGCSGTQTATAQTPLVRPAHEGQLFVLEDHFSTPGTPQENEGGPLASAAHRAAMGLDPYGISGIALRPTDDGLAEFPCRVLEGREGTVQPRSGARRPNWPGGVVPYRFHSNVNEVNRARVAQAIAILEAVCDVDWREADFVEFVSTGGDTDLDPENSSFVGRIGGRQEIRMFNWGTQGILIHEMMHAMGFYHEQSRTDRGSFVIVRLANINDSNENNFRIEPNAIASGPYDYGSIMHYGVCAFFTESSQCSDCWPGGSPQCHTVTPIVPDTALAASMGQRSAISALDSHGLRSSYPIDSWRFVNAGRLHAGQETGIGLDSWRLLTPALSQTPLGGTVFVMPGTYTLPSTSATISRAMVIQAPVGGVLIGR